ncbi:L,D-transpeptidase family protein [Gallaecimonas xiamenensis]|uniref:ErfK/YbiS/YcfS/YnhG family protein n=1 Tax=Gallaecimonas xiamenensis 3-C-1 TaxID=745411 RepID=K2JH92_9GAMM|nr:L,D-transpeptidase family protein [Gallaecimonas xiamenensis]EKE73947.1 ErfK/YbiS/YcfS/YnhG family protein [Gallaecimonas xiamenensis 3-C-1]
MRLLLSLLLLSFGVSATPYPLPDADSAYLGRIINHKVKQGDYFEAIARRYSVGPLNIIEANPGIDPLLPPPGTHLLLPTAMLLPKVERRGIVINLAELRLYYFDQAHKQVHVFPVGIGRIGLDTPLGQTTIINKQKDPVWRPTKGTRERYAEQGKTLPEQVPAGPDNPLGQYAMRLGFGNGEYLIHGTNLEAGIGMRVSAGCIRLEPRDIESLFKMVPAGTPVRVINQPVKTSVEPNGNVYLEVHEPLSRPNNEEGKTLRLSKSQQKLLSNPALSSAKVSQTLLRQPGLPVKVGRLEKEKAP